MDRRTLIVATLSLPLAARAHHGWSSFDQGRPIYLEGKAAKVAGGSGNGNRGVGGHGRLLFLVLTGHRYAFTYETEVRTKW